MHEEEFNLALGGQQRGAFTNQTEAPLEYYIEQMYDEEQNFYFRVQYTCACGEPVFRLLSDNYGFACDHCDSVCTDEICTICHNLMSVDFGDPNANL